MQCKDTLHHGYSGTVPERILTPLDNFPPFLFLRFYSVLMTFFIMETFLGLFRRAVGNSATHVAVTTKGVCKIYIYIYTGRHRRNGSNFGREFLMLNYTDITQNTYIQSWTVTEIMVREKCGHIAFPRTVRLQLCSALTVREECGTHFCDGTSSAQRDKIAFHYCRYVQCLVTPRTTEIWVRVFL